MDFSQMSDEEIRGVAEALMDNLMEASTAIDYDRHVRDFTDRAKGALTRERFQMVCEDYQARKGFFAGREFVTLFRRSDSVVVVWKQFFTRQPGEFLAEILLVQKEGRVLVDHVVVL